VRKHPLLQMLLIGSVATAIGITVGLSIHWFPTGASQQLSRTRTLYDVLMICTVPIFVLVATVVLYSAWKFHMRPGEELKDGPPIHGNTTLEVIWTVAPALLIASLCTYAFVVLQKNERSVASEHTVNVTERQFAFEFSYPLGPGRMVNSPILVLPVNSPVVFRLRSLDVVHSFFVPEFAEKLDAVPGITTILRVTPTRIGNYPAECTELCGPGHSLMRAPVRVVSRAAFSAWLSAQPVNGPPPIGVPPDFAAQPGVPGSATPATPPAGTTYNSSTAKKR
jgi:cytochrome c oxidase subunit 2